MIPVSQEYRDAIQLHRKKGFRNQTFAEVSFGLFADGAKEDSSFTISQGTAFSDANNAYWETKPIEVSYAMWEKDLFRLDGKQTFLPETSYQTQGYISELISNNVGEFSIPPKITIAFGREYSVVGLSLLFDVLSESYATEITVRTYDGQTLLEEEVAENTDGVDFKPELTLDNFNRIELIFNKVKPFQRVRLNRLLFGVGYVYRENDMVSLTHKRAAHPLSLSLPQNELQFTLYNEDNRYDIDSGNSVVRFFQKEQKITLRYGYDLTGRGDIEWFGAGVFYLFSWDVKGYQATFVAKDIIHKLSLGKFEKGKYVGWSYLASLADQIVQDVGVSNYIRPNTAVQTSAPLPYDSHSIGLQLIANASGTKLGTNADGTIKYFVDPIKSPTNPILSISHSHLPQLPFSKATDVFTSESHTYATWEEDFFTLDGTMKLLPESEEYLPSGITANIFPDSDGNYTFNGISTVFTCYFNIRIDAPEIQVAFGKGSYITSFWAAVRGVTDTQDYTHYEPNSDHIKIISAKMEAFTCPMQIRQNNKHHRLRLQNIKIKHAPLILTTDDVIGQVKQELYPEVGTLQINGKIYPVGATGYGTTTTQTLETGILLKLESSEARWFQNVLVEDSRFTVTSQEHYAHVSYVRIDGPESSVEAKLFYFPLPLVDNVESTILKTSGETATIKNPLATKSQIYDATYRTISEVASDYYLKRHGYTIDVLGYPECDANDVIVFDGKETVVLENTITMNGGATRGKMKLRGGG